jgi:gamma-glutamylcyclotransferase (GGCT)/AIG2-like uncharacterized protein YtfP
MAWPRRLFFFGTLTHEHDNHLTRTFLPRLGRARRGWVRGTLRLVTGRCGVYPVLMPGAGRVWGWAYGGTAAINRSVLAALDAWEGCDPRRPSSREYRRAEIRVHTRGGPLRAQAYLLDRRSRYCVRRVPGGDFAAHVAKCGLSVLAC